MWDGFKALENAVDAMSVNLRDSKWKWWYVHIVVVVVVF